MSRRHLSLLVVAIASLIVTACSTSPTGPDHQVKPTTVSADSLTNIRDTTGRSGWSGSGG